MKTTHTLILAGFLALSSLAVATAQQAFTTQTSKASDHEQAAATLLFVQNSMGMSYDASAKKLTLHNTSPAVTFFTDRPYRIAGHTLLGTFLRVWDEGSDSFKQNPPNADISIFEEGKIHSVVLELSEPKLAGTDLTYTVDVLEGSLPARGGVNSLFIDNMFWKGAGHGAAGGAVIGAIAGDTKKGALIGAAVGGIAGASRQSQAKADAKAQKKADKKAEDEAARTRVINVPNSNGSFIPVTLRLDKNGWKGPKGEVYPTLPTADQLKKLYGVE